MYETMNPHSTQQVPNYFAVSLKIVELFYECARKIAGKLLLKW